MKNKPKANLYMLIKIEIDKDIKDTTEFKKEFCKKNVASLSANSHSTESMFSNIFTLLLLSIIEYPLIPFLVF